MTPSIRVDDEVYSLLQHRARPFTDTPNLVLRRLLGLPDDRQPGRTDSDSASPSPANSRLGTLLERGSLVAGDELVWVRRNNGSAHVAKLGADGNLELEDGTTHPSPSAAAKHLAGYEVNGWRVWRVRRTGRSLDEEWRKAPRGVTKTTPSPQVRPPVAPVDDTETDLDADFIQALTPQLREVGTELIRRVRANWEGRLVLHGRRFVNRPDNFWTVTIQPQDGSLAITVRGNPERFFGASQSVRPDRRGYSRFKVRELTDIAIALEVLRRAQKQTG